MNWIDRRWAVFRMLLVGVLGFALSPLSAIGSEREALEHNRKTRSPSMT